MVWVQYSRAWENAKDIRQDYYKISRPQLDDGQIEEMDRLLLESYQNKTIIEITTWKDGFLNSMVGTVAKIDHIIMHDELVFIYTEFL